MVLCFFSVLVFKDGEFVYVEKDGECTPCTAHADFVDVFDRSGLSLHLEGVFVDAVLKHCGFGEYGFDVDFGSDSDLSGGCSYFL